MSLIFATRRSFLQAKGIAYQLQSINQNGKLFPIVSVACFRTGGLGKDTPHETPPMRHNTSSLDVPQLNLESATSADYGPLSASANGEVSSEELHHDDLATTKHHHHGQQVRDERFEKALLTTLTYATKVYDTITLPVYAAIQQPWKKLAMHNAPKGICVDPERFIYETATKVGSFHKAIDDSGVDTMDKVFAFATERNGTKNCLGRREVIEEIEVMDQQTGKMMKKYELGDYKWISYNEADIIATNLASGYASLGINPKGKIAIFAETRQEWLLATMGAFKRNLKIVTVFTTLGDDGVIHALNETQAPCLITTEEMMPRIKNILKHTPSIHTIIYMDGKSTSTESPGSDLPADVNVTSFSGLIEQGRQNPVEEIKPTKADEAIIMYTSGSTGTPKGVILSHYNLVSGIKSVLDVLQMHDNAHANDKYIAYLPLAHVLELMSEAICFIQGIPIGYSSPLTLTDQSLAIKPGTKGDAVILKPTIMAGVPLVIERICKGIQSKIADKGRLAQLLFQFFYKYKNDWMHKGYDTPLVNKVFFEKIRQVIGGRVRFMAIGSAPLAPETHEFIRTVLCCPVCLGYAMTESSSCGNFATAHDLTVGRVGPPVHCNQVRLVDWEEGGYRTTDKPYPRGEILLGGDNVALGYYKLRESTDFFEDFGKRWIRTGDIGEVHPDGAFKIIDRKKDLVKLSMGEYISLGKIEAVIKSSAFVENGCVCADSTHSYPVAIIVPAQIPVLKLAEEMDIPTGNFASLCRDPRIIEAVLEEIQETARQLHLNKFELPRKIHLCPDPWLPTSGLVTAAFKIRRNNVYKHYEREIDQMYNSS